MSRIIMGYLAILLTLLTIILSGYIGWRIGWINAVDFMMEHVDKKMAQAIEEVKKEENDR